MQKICDIQLAVRKITVSLNSIFVQQTQWEPTIGNLKEIKEVM